MLTALKEHLHLKNNPRIRNKINDKSIYKFNIKQVFIYHPNIFNLSSFFFVRNPPIVDDPVWFIIGFLTAFWILKFFYVKMPIVGIWGFLILAKVWLSSISGISLSPLDFAF